MTVVSEASTPEPGKPQKVPFRPPIRREAPEQVSRGLSAVEASRTERNRIKRPPLKIVLWFAMTMAVALVLYFRWEGTRIESARQTLLSKQREAAAQYGQPWFELRDRIEQWTVELAGKPEPDLVEQADLASFDFRDKPGIYLRLRQDQARDAAAVSEGAAGSLRDAFTSCLTVNRGDPPMVGKECQESAECEPGQLCNEYKRCAKPGQPYNLRQAYQGFRVLGSEFEKEIRAAPNNLTLRALDGTFEDATRIDFPIGLEMISKAEYFLVVIDERPAPEAPAKDAPEGEPSPEDLEAIAGVTYPSRIGLFRLSDGKMLLRLTSDPKVELTGAQAPRGDKEVAAAFQRQARSCALAGEVRKAMGK